MNCKDIAFIEALKESRERRKTHKYIIIKNKKVNVFTKILNKIKGVN
jgi:hypothetical protein